MADINHALPQGTFLRGPQNTYQIQQTLGQGTFGITYLATTQMKVSGQMGSFTTTVKVAVKEFFMKDFNGRDGSEVTVSSQDGYFTDYKGKFLREVENLAALQHPHIVKVLESFEANGTAYYAMENLEGGSLDSYIDQQGVLPETEALLLAGQIASALECMHQHRMLHLDLKPGNVMRRSSGEVVLIDFGLSKLFDKNGEPESSTSLGGGTAGYAPLEQTNYQRGDGLPVTMDIYAFGATLYKMLSGERPPEASEVLNDGLPTFVLEKKGISTQTIEVIEKAMSPMRRKRYQSVREMVSALMPQEEPRPAAAKEKPIASETEAEETILTLHKTPTSRSKWKSGLFWQKLSNTQKGIMSGAAAAFLVILFALLWPKDTTKDSSSNSQQLTQEIVEAVKPTTATDLSCTCSVGDYRFTGPIDTDGKPHGKGTAIFSNGRRYEGPFVHGTMEGTDARFVMKNGDVFTGEFRENRFYKGCYTVKEDGSYFEGSFKGGQPDQGNWYDKNGNKL